MQSTCVTLRREQRVCAERWLQLRSADGAARQAVAELHRDCANKRRRANLPQAARFILEEWFRANSEHPYPSDADKDRLAARAGITNAQVSNWSTPPPPPLVLSGHAASLTPY